jgi:hypothetical protein
MEIRDVLANLEKLVGPYTMQKPEVLLVSQEEYQLLYACAVDNAEVLVHNLTLNGQLRYRGVLVFHCLSNKELRKDLARIPIKDLAEVHASLEALYERIVKKALVAKLPSPLDKLAEAIAENTVVFDDFVDYVSDQSGATGLAYWIQKPASQEYPNWKNETIDQLPGIDPNGPCRWGDLHKAPVQEFQMSHPLEPTGWDELPEPDARMEIKP